MRATRVGIDTKPFLGKHPIRTCARCGIQWHINLKRPKVKLCVDCRSVLRLMERESA